MRQIGLIAGFVAAIAAVGGGAAAAKGASGTKPPAELLASVSRGPATGLDGLRAFANAIKPGVGAMLNDTMVDTAVAQVVGATSLAGLDRASAGYVLYVDGGGVKGVAYVGKIADDKAFTTAAGSAFVARQNGWAVIGPKPVVDKVSAYAFTTLAVQPNVSSPTATAFMSNVLARFKAEIASGRAMVVANASPADPMSGFMIKYVDGVLGALDQTDRLVLTVDADKDTGAVDFALVPKAGTKLAKFVAAQKATDYALVDKLPDTSAPIVFAGHLEAGPYRQDLMDMMAGMYSMPKELLALYQTIMKASTGDVAMTMSIVKGQGMAVTYLFGLADRKTADAAITRVFAVLAKSLTTTTLGMKQTITAVPGSTDHDGVALRAYDTTLDMSTVPAKSRAAMQATMPNGTMRSELATFDDLGVVAMGADADAMAFRAIDAARGKGARRVASKEIATALAASKARKDSFAMVIDFGAFAAMTATPAKLTGQMLMSGGFADGAAHFRMQLPSATFRSFKP